MERYELVEFVREYYKYERYLEIGLYAGETFEFVRARSKVSVDPNPACKATHIMISDDFFKQNKERFDLIFVDGLHLQDQAYRDVLNALLVLDSKGTVIVHDCNPEYEAKQKVPRPNVVGPWSGDVWKAWVKLRATQKNVRMAVVNCDCGMGLIQFGHQETIAMPPVLDYAGLEEHREEWLNLIEVEGLEGWLSNK